MTRMQHETRIARDAETVLAYAASPRRWPEWHPSSLAVVGGEGPLAPGQTFEEDVRAGGREGHLSWNVVEYERGVRWRARARGTYGLVLDLTYEVYDDAEGTRFVRTLAYELGSLAMRIANVLVLSRRIRKESAESLRILRAVLERAPR